MVLLQKKYTLIFWSFLFFLNLFLRSAALYTPILDVDETQFAGFAHVLMDGGLPYLHSLDTKPLGIYLFYWLVFAVFGRTNMVAVHFITALVTFAAAFFLAKIFYRFQYPYPLVRGTSWLGLTPSALGGESSRACPGVHAGDKEGAGRLAALLFVIFSTTFVPKYMATSINSVMVLFLVLSVYFMAKVITQGARWDALWAGLFAGIALIFKYTAGIQWVFYVVVLFVLWLVSKKSPQQKTAQPTQYAELSSFASHPATFKTVLLHNLYFFVGFIFPFFVQGMILLYLGVWDDFVFWSLQGSASYISQGGATIFFWKSFFVRFGGFVLATFFLWYYSLQSLKLGLFKEPLFLVLLLWFFSQLIPVCIGGRFYPHYFIPLLPPLCGLAALGATTIKPLSKNIIVGLILVPALLFWILRLDYHTFLNYFPDDGIYEQQEIGKYIKKMATPEDSMFVWGFATGIYFYSGVKPASRFLWADLLTGRTPGPYYARVNQESEAVFQNPVAWQAFWDDMNKNPPEYFVDTSPADMHDYGRFPLKNYPKLFEYVQKNYDKVDNELGVDVYVARGL